MHLLKRILCVLVAGVLLLTLSLTIPTWKPTPAYAQNVVCSTAALGDNSNRCASTGFVQNAINNLQSVILAAINAACAATPNTCSAIFGYTNIVWYGADPNGVSDSGAACTAALNSFEIHTGGTLTASRGSYKLTTSCVIPPFVQNGGTGGQPIIKFQFAGAQFFPATNNMVMFDRFPACQSGGITCAENTVAALYDFSGGQITGINPLTGVQMATGVTGIRLGASYGSFIHGMLFSWALDIGLDLQFALNAKVTNVRCNNITSYCMIAREGQWTGANSNNSQSNDTEYNNVRDSSPNGELASFYIHATDGVRIINAICEGGNPSQCILFDDDRNTTVKSLVVNGLHVENAGSGTVNAIVTMKGAGGGVYTFQNVFNQTISTFLDVSGFDASGQIFNILDTDYAGAFGGTTATFKVQVGDSNIWNFRAWPGGASKPPTDTFWWSGGNVPAGIISIGDSNGLVNFSRKVFGNPTATNSTAFGIGLYGPMTPNLSDTFSNGTSLLRWTDAWIGSGGIDNLAGMKAYSGTAIPAGGTGGKGNTFSSTANFGTFFGSGAPTLSAARGSVYLRSDGSPYYNTNGSTGWDGLLTATNPTITGSIGLSGSAPGLSSCGTSPAISGTDLAGTVTMGTGAPTSCTLTFVTTKSASPHCAVTWRANLATMQYAVAPTSIILTQTGTSSNQVDYVCAGQ
jgi:hypothetical protein